MHEPHTLQPELEAFAAMASQVNMAGLSPVAEAYLKLALGSLNDAVQQLDLANLFQAQALAGTR
jgi:hypothetical protein